MHGDIAGGERHQMMLKQIENVFPARNSRISTEGQRTRDNIGVHVGIREKSIGQYRNGGVHPSRSLLGEKYCFGPWGSRLPYDFISVQKGGTVLLPYLKPALLWFLTERPILRLTFKSIRFC
ncbi:hypothetical protein NE237_003109 [Protea cynaroides]|uniref:Uncharacterized protein n=1 Tax=Protea cynaroides TaxID=273540 RepID=A0A9Q0KGG7_9MAGN|nr:hypothetical protein NE237_003109 [Protea cynaroides]